MWWHGPSWLVEFKPNDIQPVSFECHDEERTILLPIVIKYNLIIELVNKNSSIRKCRNIIAWLLRFKSNLVKKTEKMLGPLTENEIQYAMNKIIKAIQNLEFGDEIQRLKTSKIISKGRFSSLSPYLDPNDIIRVGGRLQNSNLNEELKHSIILPKGHFSDLIIRQAHNDFYHVGPKALMAIVRQRYWILGLRDATKRITRTCTNCIRFKGKTMQTIMAPLPKERVEMSKPFSRTGVDFAGPINVFPYRGRGKTSIKSYIALFVCFATKAIHLELVTSLDTQSFIMALKRFIARRGRCTDIWSDNGRNFSGCSKELINSRKHIETAINSEEVRVYLADNIIRWHFIPPYTPHFGGLWEAGVKSVKTHLFRMFANASFSIEELTTILCQIEAVLNSRPLTPFSDDLEDITILTPAHFLIGSPAVELPVLGLEDRPINHLKRFRLIQDKLNEFWKKWSMEYLNTLQMKSKWKRVNKNIKVGDLVLIKRSCDPPAFWSKGRIVKTFPGPDNITRVAEVKTVSGMHRKAISNLIPLNLDESTIT